MTQPTSDRQNDIAIIGMSGRFPGAATVEAFWKNLCQGVESITPLTDDELLAAGVERDLLDHPDYVKAGAFLENIEEWDAAFFNVSPAEARVTDPQHRLFLECAWEAMEVAGYDTARYEGIVSVFAGAGFNRYLLANLIGNPALEGLDDTTLMIANDNNFIATRVSYKLNLKGAGLTVQTACSTSLVAIHTACQSLLNGECDIALAGAASIAVPHKTGYLYREGGVASPDGQVRAFDAGANGSVFGSGVGVVVLKRLEDALADGDTVYAVVKGSAVNNDGSHKVSYTAPSIEAQAEVIAEAQALANVAPESVSYIETHGTGTLIGDPMEITALNTVFQEATDRTGYCAIGSLKTNVGHLDVASGVSGLIKTSLMLKEGVLPASLHYEQANPQIDFANSPFYVNTELKQWETQGEPRRAGLSSFGFGGTNAHVVMEQPPELEPNDPARPWQLLLLSAKTETALEAMTDRLQEGLAQRDDLDIADAAYTLQTGRRQFTHRRAVLVQDLQEAQEILSARDHKRMWSGLHDDTSRSVAFLFSGTGAQYPNMGRELYDTEPLFQERIDLCCDLLRPHLGYDLREILFPDDEAGEARATVELKQTSTAQISLFVIEYALSRLLLEWGVVPQAAIGHSVGEYAAATVAGVFALEDALQLVVKRGELFNKMPQGAMLAVNMTEAEILPLMGPELNLGAINEDQQVVVSGTVEAIEGLEAQLRARDIRVSRVNVDRAAHSFMLDEVLAEFRQMVARFALQAPSLPFVSNVTGTWITPEQAVSPEYWAQHLRHTVRFHDGLTTLAADPNLIALEIGPGNTLSSMAQRTSLKSHLNLSTLPSLQQKRQGEAFSDLPFLLTTVGKLWLGGITPDWYGFYGEERRRRVPLPTYPFERQRYWVDREAGASAATALAGQKPRSTQDWFYTPVWKQTPALACDSEKEFVSSKRWLLFLDEGGYGARLASRLQELGQEVFTVRMGDSFAQTGERAYEINPQTYLDYDALMNAIGGGGQSIDRVLHMWSLTPPGSGITGPEAFAEQQASGFDSVLLVTKAIANHGQIDPLDLWVLGNHLVALDSRDALMPEKAPLLGACKVIPQEVDAITARVIDVCLPKANSKQEQVLFEQWLTEFARQPQDRLIAYRGRQRFVQTFESLDVQKATDRPPRLREQGVYLITGGLGFIGSRLATYLAKTVQAKLVLTGRTPLPPREEWEKTEVDDEIAQRISLVQELERYGSEVLYVTAEATDEDAMLEAIRQTHARFGDLHGVIHAASVFEPDAFAVLQDSPLQASNPHVPTQVYGTYVLEQALSEQELDFCLLISALTTVLGGLGFLSHAAAYAFQDAFAQQTNEHSAFPWIVANLDDKILEQAEEICDYVLSTEGIDTFVVSHDDLTVSLKKWITFEREAETSDTASTQATSARPNIGTTYVAPRDETEERIAAFWEEILGIDQVGMRDNFFDLGGNSLLATQLSTRLKASFEIDLPLRIIFETGTIEELSVVIEEMLIRQILEGTYE
ncbi:MAG TPA: beta-ketoacyl synthase N-terminal-like domain-containing protein [Bacilli bacterium]|nr:beta-ketoacyl synthase N-terminal-like domain-containing protein [Bacilli bacterium]